MNLFKYMSVMVVLFMLFSCKDEIMDTQSDDVGNIALKSSVAQKDLTGTWKIKTLSVFGGAWPEYGGSAVFNDMAQRNWNWHGDGTGPIAEYDNTLIFVQQGINESGNPYGRVINDSGADEKYANFIFLDDSDGVRTPIDVNHHYRKIPKGESSWVLDTNQGTVTFTDIDQVQTVASFVAPAHLILDQNTSFDLENYALTFELQPSFTWIDIYKDREKFVENPKRLWVQMTKVSNSTDPKKDVMVSTTVTSAAPFAGIGPQWGGYDNIKKWTGNNTLSDADWQKVFKRVDFMRPGLVRIMIGQGWNYYSNGNFDPEMSKDILFKILDYCQQHNINVMFGEWGENPLSNGQVDEDWITRSIDFLDYLLNTKNYTCIKYLNMLNEPAGDWSSIGGDYNLWQRHYQSILSKLSAKGLNSKITVIAPDIAVWNDMNLSHWITNAQNYFGNQIGAYDIHTYPTDEQVKSGDYYRTIAGHRELIPAYQQMIMGELGYKYDPTSTLGLLNAQRIANDPHSSDDSNMMVYDAFYGVDVTDATIQNLDAGYNGVILWDLDDAMYDNGSDKLKRWGFWNILGAERFGGEWDEAIRPWFYPMSLMCRYFPQGSVIYKTYTPDKKGLHATTAMKNGKYTIAIVNSHTENHTIRLMMENNITLTDSKHYKYVAGNGAQFYGTVDQDGFPTPHKSETMDFANNKYHEFDIPAQSLILITNMD